MQANNALCPSWFPRRTLLYSSVYKDIGWLMISWWPHIGMHVHNAPDNLQGLIYIDYLFHVPLMIAVAVLAYCFFSLVRPRIRAL